MLSLGPGNRYPRFYTEAVPGAFLRNSSKVVLGLLFGTVTRADREL